MEKFSSWWNIETVLIRRHSVSQMTQYQSDDTVLIVFNWLRRATSSDIVSKSYTMNVSWIVMKTNYINTENFVELFHSHLLRMLKKQLI